MIAFLLTIACSPPQSAFEEPENAEYRDEATRLAKQPSINTLLANPDPASTLDQQIAKLAPAGAKATSELPLRCEPSRYGSCNMLIVAPTGALNVPLMTVTPSFGIRREVSLSAGVTLTFAQVDAIGDNGTSVTPVMSLSFALLGGFRDDSKAAADQQTISPTYGLVGGASLGPFGAILGYDFAGNQLLVGLNLKADLIDTVAGVKTFSKMGTWFNDLSKDKKPLLDAHLAERRVLLQHELNRLREPKGAPLTHPAPAQPAAPSEPPPPPSPTSSPSP